MNWIYYYKSFFFKGIIFVHFEVFSPTVNSVSHVVFRFVCSEEDGIDSRCDEDGDESPEGEAQKVRVFCCRWDISPEGV
jgi:hypothetical protein